MGFASCNLFKLIDRATREGSTVIADSRGLSRGFLTSRGIKQGCPASPILFALLLSGLERRLARLVPHTGI